MLLEVCEHLLRKHYNLCICDEVIQHFCFFSNWAQWIVCKNGKEKELKTVNEIVVFRQITEEGDGRQ